MSELISQAYNNTDLSFIIEKATPIVLRSPIASPVKTSFGTMTDRPAVFLSLEDTQGYVGVGEIWCNFPSCGAEHRAKLLETTILPSLVGKEFSDPQQCFIALQSQLTSWHSNRRVWPVSSIDSRD